MNDSSTVTSNVSIVVRGPDGKVKSTEECHNLVTTVGKNYIAEQLLDTPTVGVPTHLAIGTGTTAAAVGNTDLVSELDRNAFTTKTRSGAVVTITADFGAGEGTGSIAEVGLFNDSVDGDLYARAVFTAQDKQALDTLSVTWTLTVS